MACDGRWKEESFKSGLNFDGKSDIPSLSSLVQIKDKG